MKNRFLFLSLITVLVLTSCQNFLTSSELKEAIEKEILIANSNIPEILSAEPKLTDGGVYSDSNIIVSFSKPMDSKYLSDFSNITITDSNGTNLANHYLSPVLSSDGRTLTVAHDPSNYITVEEGSLKTVKVTLSKNIQDTETIPLKNDYTWTYNINSKKDDKAPEFLSGTTLKGSSAPMQEGTFANLITTLGADNFFTETYHVNSVNIDLKSSDSGSGVAKLIVKEKLLYGVSGIDVRENNICKETVFTDFLKEGISYSLSTKYDFSQDFADGIVELTLIIEDKCGNKSEKTFAMVKDTEVTAIYDNAFGDDANPNVSKTESNNYFEIKNVTSKPWATWKGTTYRDIINFEQIQLLDSKYNFLENGVRITPERYYYYFSSITNSENFYIRATFRDQCGNTDIKEIHINSAPLVTSTYDNWTKSTENCIFFSSHNKTESDRIYAVYSTDGINYSSKEDEIEISLPKDIYSVYFKFIYNSSFEFSTYSNAYTYLNEASNFNLNVNNLLECEIIPTNDVSKEGYNLKITVNDEELLNKENLSFIFSAPTGDYSIASKVQGKNTIINFDMEEIYNFYKCSYTSHEDQAKIICIGLCYIENNKFYHSSLNYSPLWYKENQWSIVPIENIVSSAVSNCKDSIKPTITSPNNLKTIRSENYHHISLPVSVSDAPNRTEDLLNEQGNVPATIYWTPDHSQELSLKEILLLKKIETEVYIPSYNPSGNSVSGYLPIDVIFDELAKTGKYDFDIYLFVKDKAGNSSYIYRTFYSLGENYTITYDNNSISEKLTLTENTDYEFDIDMFNIGETVNFYGTGSYKYQVNNTNLKQSRNAVDNVYPKSIIYENDAAVSKFIKLEATIPNSLISINYKKVLSLDNGTIYYIFTKETPCNLKNIFVNNDKLTVFNDQPAFVHTVTSPHNFGNNIFAWEQWTPQDYKLNEQVIDPATTGMYFNNYDYPISDIPSGWYYAAIIYFADNTSTIGTVFQN